MNVDRPSNMGYIERVNYMCIALKVFYKHYRGRKFYMNRSENVLNKKRFIPALLFLSLIACAASTKTSNYRDPAMDFAALQTIAVMPFTNLTSDKAAAARVRDTFVNYLLSTGAIYVIPTGEIARGIGRSGMADPAAPSLEEITKFAAIVKVDAVITGVVREYGEVRSGTTSANVISVSMQMFDVQSKKIVWTAASTKGGINMGDRLLGGGGQPMNDVTEAAIDDIITQLFE